jgi:hypothetical protein
MRGAGGRIPHLENPTVKLPRTVHSYLGPVPVTVVPQSAFPNAVNVGQWSERHRQIMLSDDLSADAAVQVLCHEMVHVALTDSGAGHILEQKAGEMLCDALGYYIASAVRSGHIRLCNPK